MLEISKRHLSVGKIYSTSPHAIWDVITDTTQWPRWGPTVNAVRYPGRYIGKNSSGRVLTVIGLWLPFVVTEFEPGRFWSWKVASIKATGHRLEMSTTGKPVLWFEVPTIAFPYLAICQIALNRIAGCIAD
jgi:hypothetical protein